MMNAAAQKQADFTQKGSTLIQSQLTQYRSPQNDDLIKASTSDAYINSVASKIAVEERKNSLINKLERGLLLVGLPVAASITDGALTPAKSVAEKAKNTLKSAKGWGIAIAALFGAYKGLNSIIKKTPVLKEFKEESPGLTTVGVVAGTAGAIWGSNSLVDAVASKIGQINPINKKLVKPLKEWSTKLGEKFNNSKLSSISDKGLFEPVKTFFQKTNVGKFVYKSSVPLIIGGVILKFIADLEAISRNKNKITVQLKEDRRQKMLNIAMNNPFSAPSV